MASLVLVEGEADHAASTIDVVLRVEVVSGCWRGQCRADEVRSKSLDIVRRVGRCIGIEWWVLKLANLDRRPIVRTHVAREQSCEGKKRIDYHNGNEMKKQGLN